MDYKEFYKNGIIDLDFQSEKINELLFDILNNNVKLNFSLCSKYNKTFDLRPNVIEYDQIFLKALKDNMIKEKISYITQRDLTLYHIQVRVVEDEKSYMSWHRDTYYTPNGLSGKEPHGVKMIYYPKFSMDNEERLLYLLGSNRILFPINSFDNQLFNILKVKKVYSSNEKSVLFDVNGLHAVVPEEKNNKSIRLIYSFLNKQQLIDDHQVNNDIHIKTMEMYEELYSL